MRGVEVDGGMVDRLEYSRSKTRTWQSPAQVTSVLSLEPGINLTENIFSVWPVKTVVLSANRATEDSGWYECILICRSSLPEARSLPDEDQLKQDLSAL